MTVTMRETDKARVVDMVREANENLVFIRFNGLFYGTLDLARTADFYTCPSVYCGRRFLYVSTAAPVYRSVAYCSKRCKKNAANERQLRRRSIRRGTWTPELEDLMGRVSRNDPPQIADDDDVSLPGGDRMPPLDERDRQERCPRPTKKFWNTKEAAVEIIRQMRAEKKPRSEHLQAYECDKGGIYGTGCGYWHVGDPRPKNRIPAAPTRRPR